MNRVTRLFTIIFLMLCASFGTAQDNAYGSIDNGGPYIIDLHSLSVQLHIPIRTIGKDSLEYNETYSLAPLSLGAQLWPTYSFVSQAPYGEKLIKGLGGWNTLQWGTSTPVQCLSGGTYYSRNKFTHPYFADASGIIHNLPIGWYYYEGPIGNCTNNYSLWKGSTLDNSGMYADATGGPGTLHVWDKSGIEDLGYTDTDGNSFSVATNEFGAPFLTSISNGFRYNDAGNNPRNITETVVTGNIKTSFNCPNNVDISTATTIPNMVTAVNYPDGTSLGIAYEATAGFSGYVTGRIHQLTLPTGGTITFGYGGGNAPGPGLGMDCQGWGDGGGGFGPTVLTKTSSLGTWTYTAVHSLGTNRGGSTTTVTDPAGNNIVHTFQRGLEVMTKIYTGGGINCASGCTNPVKTVYHCYNNWSSGTIPTGCGDVTLANPNGVLPVSGAITEEDVHTAIPGVSGYAETATTYSTVSNPTIIKQFNFGASSPSTITNITYGSYVGGTCNAIGTVVQNILDRPCEITVSDGTNVSSDTRYTYNSTGHATTIYRLAANSQPQLWLATNIYYNSNGTVSTYAPPSGSSTTYAYNGTGGCAGLLPTSVTTGSLVYYYTWDCNTGSVLSVTDSNGAVVSDSYTNGGADPLYRLKSRTLPNGETVNYDYSPTSVEKSMVFGTSSLDQIGYVDAYGRPTKTQTAMNGAWSTWNNSISISGSNIQVTSSEVPCVSSTKGGTCTGPTATSAFNVLGNFVSMSTAEGSTLTSTYAGLDVLTTLGPAPTGENTKRIQVERNGLGQITNVCDLGSAGTGCGQATAATGWSTAYTYTQLGPGIRVVASRGGQQHTVVKDGAGRVISTTTPETGTTSYLYDSDPNNSGCAPRTFLGALLRRINNDGSFECYGLDPTGRVTDIGSNSALNAGGTTACKRFRYDAASNGIYAAPTGYAAANTAGRVVEATTDDCTWPASQAHMLTDEWFSYDPEGHITDLWESTPHSGGFYHTSATYFANGAIGTLSGIPGYATTTYGLNPDGFPTSALDGTVPMVSSVTRNAEGQPLTVDIGVAGGDTDNYGYDPYSGLLNNWTFTVGSTPVSQTGTLTWNANGTLNKLVIGDGFFAAGAQTCVFGYGDLGYNTSSNCGAAWSQTISRDMFGNETKSGSSSWSPGYNASNNYIIGATYDGNGRPTYDGVNHYTWDVYGNLATVVTSGTPSCGTAGTCLEYDAFDRMVEKSSNTNYFEILYSPIGKTAEMQGATTVKYAYLPTPGGGMVTDNGSRTYNHVDWTGSARLGSTVNNRTMAYDRAFAPDGEMYDTTGNGNVFLFGLTQEDSSVNGLFDALLGEYHPGQGRYIAPVSGNWNPYTK